MTNQALTNTREGPGGGGIASYHVLGERLGKGDVVALLDKVSQRKSVLVDVAAGEALVGHVEEGEVALVLDGSLNRPSTGPRWGSTPVGLCAQAWNRKTLPSGAALTSPEQALKVQPDGVLVVVARTSRPPGRCP